MSGGSERRAGGGGKPGQCSRRSRGRTSSGRGRRGSGRVVEVTLGERRDCGDRLARLRSSRGDEDLVSLTDTKGRKRVEAAPAGGAARGRQVRDGDLGVEPARRLDKARGRARMQAERI